MHSVRVERFTTPAKCGVFHRIKDHEPSSALPRKVSNGVLRQRDRD